MVMRSSLGLSSTNAFKFKAMLQCCCSSHKVVIVVKFADISYFIRDSHSPANPVEDCIVLYLYIIVFLAVHTNQKRFQCERPREKRDCASASRVCLLSFSSSILFFSSCRPISRFSFSAWVGYVQLSFCLSVCLSVYL